MLTPETTDISGQSASEVEVDTSTDLDTASTSGAESDATVGSRDHSSPRPNGPLKRAQDGGLSAGEYDVEGYYLEYDSASERSVGANGQGEDAGEETFRAEGTEDAALRARLAHIALESSNAAAGAAGAELYRVPSHASIGSVGSSHYASSEASEFTTASSIGMGDSLTLPPSPAQNGVNSVPVTGWQPARSGLLGTAGTRAGEAAGGRANTVPLAIHQLGQVRQRPGWEDRPTFFDYLYGQ